MIKVVISKLTGALSISAKGWCGVAALTILCVTTIVVIYLLR